MKYEDFKTKPCIACDGVGVTPDHEDIGSALRAKREAANFSLREMAGYLKISAPYLSDLELGRRNWSKPMFERYLKQLPK